MGGDLFDRPLPGYLALKYDTPFSLNYFDPPHQIPFRTPFQILSPMQMYVEL